MVGDLELPYHFITDLTSIPRPVEWLIPRVGPYMLAALGHDLLYQTGRFGKDRRGRLESDLWMYQRMIHDGTNPRRAYIIYKGLRVGGWYAWNKHRRSEKQSGH
jgi:hypothetical protein